MTWIGDIISRNEKQRRCVEEHNGHQFGSWSETHIKHYQHYPSKPASGKKYAFKLRVCKLCKMRERETVNL